MLQHTQDTDYSAAPAPRAHARVGKLWAGDCWLPQSSAYSIQNTRYSLCTATERPLQDSSN